MSRFDELVSFSLEAISVLEECAERGCYVTEEQLATLDRVHKKLEIARLTATNYQAGCLAELAGRIKVVACG